MRRARWRVALLAVTISGCAALRGGGEPSPQARLDEGLAALEQRDFVKARAVLDPLYRAHWDRPVGRQAMLALIAAELDSRNPERRLAAAADLSARFLNIDGIADWQVPVAESYYLIALELGANEERLARAEAKSEQAQQERAEVQQALSAADGGRKLPTSDRESVPARIRRLTGERDEAQRRAAAAEQRLAAREKELQEAQQELERIRKTLKP